jgi:two-component system cell cycle response regulator DivK
MHHESDATDSRHEASTAEREAKANVLGAPTPPAVPPPCVLIVDDDPDARAIHAEVLQRRGFRTTEAENGEAGIQMAASRRPDVILMDSSMPGMSGDEVASRLKGDARTRAIPIVMLTGFARRTSPSPAWDAYLEKPSTADGIAETLRSVLAGEQSTRTC